MNRFPNQPHAVSGEPVDAIVREIVQRSAAITRTRLHHDAADMTSGEFRGYVRARAFAPVRFQVQQLAAEGKLPADLVEHLMERALERTVYLVARETSRPIVAAPPAYVPLRAAA